MCRKIIFLFLLLILSPLSLLAGEKKPLDITSDEVEYTKVNGKEVVIFTGQVVAIQDTTTLKCQRLKLFPAEKKVVGEGHVWVKDKKQKMILTGERIEYYHDKRYGIVTGNPRLIGKKKNFTLTASEMETFIPEDRFRAKREVTLIRDNLVATSQVLDYFAKEKKAILTGDPKIREGGSLATGEKITLFVDERRIVIEGGAEIEFIPEVKEK